MVDTDADRRRASQVLTGIGVLFTAAIVFWLVRDQPTEFLTDRLGMNAQALRVPWAWVLALAIAAGYIFYTAWAVPLVNERKFELSGLKLVGVWVAFGSGIVEEVVFRQLLMDWASSVGLHVAWQIVISAVVFGLGHASWVLLRGEFSIAIPVVLSTAVLGALLAIVYVVAGRNALPAIAAHTLINLVIEPWLILAAVSGKWGQEKAEN